MASPTQWLRTKERQLQQYQRDQQARHESDDFGTGSITETTTIRDRRRRELEQEIRLFRRLNPAESDNTRIDQLPYAVRGALGDWRQWYVVTREQGRRLRAGRDTRFFMERQGRWRENGPLDRPMLGERWIVVRRMRVPESGSSQAAPASLPPSAPQGGPPTIIYPITESNRTGGDELRIRVYGRTGATPRTFTLTGGGRREQRRVKAEDEHYVRFRGLQSGQRYSLQVGSNDLESHDLIHDAPHARLMEGAAGLRGYLQDHGLDAAAYVLRHEKNSDGQVTLVVSVDPPQFGVFFDGTGNNLYNDVNREDRAPTNIAKLYNLHFGKERRTADRFYGAGIGTETGGEDSLVDQAIAISFSRRIMEALGQTKQFAGEVALAKTIIIDVFGFSRGAAQARAFINQVLALKRDDPEYFGGPEPVIRFAGLFDTVGSVGVPGNASNHNAIAARGLSSPIGLALDPDTVDRVLHLTAGDEIRANFPSSSLRTSADAPLPDHFEEHELPGVHADIGGGYTDLPDVVHYPRMVVRWESVAERDREVAAERERLMTEHAKPGIRIEAETAEYIDYTTPSERRTSVAIFTWERDIDPSLAHYPLELIHKAAVDAGVPLKPLETLGRLGHAYEISDELRELIENAKQQGRGSPAYEALFRGYIHHSHQHGVPRSHEPGGGDLNDLVNTNRPQTDAEHTTSNGARAVFYADTPDGESAQAATP